MYLLSPRAEPVAVGGVAQKAAPASGTKGLHATSSPISGMKARNESMKAKRKQHGASTVAHLGNGAGGVVQQRPGPKPLILPPEVLENAVTGAPPWRKRTADGKPLSGAPAAKTAGTRRTAPKVVNSGAISNMRGQNLPYLPPARKTTSPAPEPGGQKIN